jgi:LysR family transcriptional repressor of citA
VLASRRLQNHNRPPYWDDLLLVLYQLGLHVQTIRMGQVEVTKRLIKEELGLSFLPHSTVWRELGEGRFLEVPTPGLDLPTAETWIITPAAAPRKAAIAFRDTVTAQFP